MSENDNAQPQPPGYKQLVPFTRDGFKGLGKQPTAQAEFARELNSLLITAVEFFPAARHYPIVFARDTTSGRHAPIVITGLESGQNLFVSASGDWLSGNYVPAYVRRWPFFSAQWREQPEKMLVLVDPAGLAPSDQPYVDANGEPTPLWEHTERSINEMEKARLQTLAFTRALEALDLIEPFDALAMGSDGKGMRLAGLNRISEERLNKLPDAKIKELMNQGYLSRIYAHLVSLENFQRLMDLRAERAERKH